MASMDIFYSKYGRGVLCSYAIRTDFLSNFQDISVGVIQILLQSVSLSYCQINCNTVWKVYQRMIPPEFSMLVDMVGYHILQSVQPVLQFI